MQASIALSAVAKDVPRLTFPSGPPMQVTLVEKIPQVGIKWVPFTPLPPPLAFDVHGDCPVQEEGAQDDEPEEGAKGQRVDHQGTTLGCHLVAQVVVGDDGSRRVIEVHDRGHRLVFVAQLPIAHGNVSCSAHASLVEGVASMPMLLTHCGHHGTN